MSLFNNTTRNSNSQQTFFSNSNPSITSTSAFSNNQNGLQPTISPEERTRNLERFFGPRPSNPFQQQQQQQRQQQRQRQQLVNVSANNNGFGTTNNNYQPHILSSLQAAPPVRSSMFEPRREPETFFGLDQSVQRVRNQRSLFNSNQPNVNMSSANASIFHNQPFRYPYGYTSPFTSTQPNSQPPRTINLPNRENIRSGRNASLSTRSQGLANLNQNLNGGQPISSSNSRSIGTFFLPRPQPTPTLFQGSQTAQNTPLQQLNNRLNPPLNPTPSSNNTFQFASQNAYISAQLSKIHPAFSSNLIPQTMTAPPNGQLQIQQQEPIPFQIPGNNNISPPQANTNLAPPQEIPQEESQEENEISSENDENNGEDVKSFSEDLEGLLINHQMVMPEMLFQNTDFVQNLTQFLQGYSIKPSKKTLLCPVSAQEREINLPLAQGHHQGEPVHVEEENPVKRWIPSDSVNLKEVSRHSKKLAKRR